MLTKGLDQETKKFLDEILAQEKTTTDELIKNLIRDRWMAMNQSSEEVSEVTTPASREAEATVIVAEPAADGIPSHPSGAAKHKSNKQAIAEFISKKRRFR